MPGKNPKEDNEQEKFTWKNFLAKLVTSANYLMLQNIIDALLPACLKLMTLSIVSHPSRKVLQNHTWVVQQWCKRDRLTTWVVTMAITCAPTDPDKLVFNNKVMYFSMLQICCYRIVKLLLLSNEIWTQDRLARQAISQNIACKSLINFYGWCHTCDNQYYTWGQSAVCKKLGEIQAQAHIPIQSQQIFSSTFPRMSISPLSFAVLPSPLSFVVLPSLPHFLLHLSFCHPWSSLCLSVSLFIYFSLYSLSIYQLLSSFISPFVPIPSVIPIPSQSTMLTEKPRAYLLLWCTGCALPSRISHVLSKPSSPPGAMRIHRHTPPISSSRNSHRWKPLWLDIKEMKTTHNKPCNFIKIVQQHKSSKSTHKALRWSHQGTGRWNECSHVAFWDLLLWQLYVSD